MKMYAVIRDKGREFKVSEGDIIQLDKNRLDKGDAIEFDEVLLCSDGDNIEVGQPFVSGAKVTGEVLGEAKSKRIVAIKFRRRKNSRTRKGSRQVFTKVRITSIQKP